jgi:hypothetical protein
VTATETPAPDPCPHCACCVHGLCVLAAHSGTECSAKASNPMAADGCPCTVSDAARAETLAFADPAIAARRYDADEG